MLAGDRPSNKEMDKAFPLFINGEFDFHYKHSPWQIGLKSTAPDVLKKKIAAAFVSEIIGAKSMDRLLKQQAVNIDYPVGDAQRLDLRIRSYIDVTMKSFGSALMAISHVKRYQNFGAMLSGWALMRAPFGVEIMAYGAQRGALFETLSILRSLIEQMAWACAVSDLPDDSTLDRIKAQHCIGRLRALSPRCGKLYGWLSDHAHWNIDAHAKSMITQRGYIGHLYASSYFKALSFAAILLLVISYIEILNKLYWSPRSRVAELSCGSPKSLQKTRLQITKFFQEIVALDKEDVELNELAFLLLTS